MNGTIIFLAVIGGYLAFALACGALSTLYLATRKPDLVALLHEHIKTCVVAGMCELKDDYLHVLSERVAWKIMHGGSRRMILIANLVGIAIWNLDWPIQVLKHFPRPRLRSTE